MAQPTENQINSVYGQFLAAMDAVEGVTEYNIGSVYGQFLAVIDATDSGGTPAARIPFIGQVF